MTEIKQPKVNVSISNNVASISGSTNIVPPPGPTPTGVVFNFENLSTFSLATPTATDIGFIEDDEFRFTSIPIARYLVEGTFTYNVVGGLNTNTIAGIRFDNRDTAFDNGAAINIRSASANFNDGNRAQAFDVSSAPVRTLQTGLTALTSAYQTTFDPRVFTIQADIDVLSDGTFSPSFYNGVTIDNGDFASSAVILAGGTVTLIQVEDD